MAKEFWNLKYLWSFHKGQKPIKSPSAFSASRSKGRTASLGCLFNQACNQGIEKYAFFQSARLPRFLISPLRERTSLKSRYILILYPSIAPTDKTDGTLLTKDFRFTQRGFQNPRTRPEILHPLPGKEQPPHRGNEGIRNANK